MVWPIGSLLLAVVETIWPGRLSRSWSRAFVYAAFSGALVRAARHLAASSIEMIRRAPTCISRGPLPCFFNSK